jgi:peroxiredoxin
MAPHAGECRGSLTSRHPTSRDGTVSRRSLSTHAWGVAEGLVGLSVPSVVLTGFPGGGALDLGRLAAVCPLVIYLYPGSSNSPADGEQTPLLDAAQHRAFHLRRVDLEARDYSVVGVSSQSSAAQRHSVLAGRLTQRLLCDPELQLAKELPLPTFEHDRASWYQRLTLVASCPAHGGCERG